MGMRTVIGLLIVTSVAISGCATTAADGRNASRNPTVYAGTRLNFAAVREDYARLSTYQKYGIEAPQNPALDMPLSVFADTLLLPMDAWYWATDKVPGLTRPSWAGIATREFDARSTGSADSDREP